MRPLVACLACLLALSGPLCADEAPAWKAGVAAQVITPDRPLWLAGYAGRTKPSEGKEHDLFVKAVALEDPKGQRLVVVTSDLITVPRALAVEVARRVQAKTKLPRERLMLTCSHTHCSPALDDSLLDMYPMPADEAKKALEFLGA